VRRLVAFACLLTACAASAPAAGQVASPCFGAASRDPERPCHDTALAAAVHPSPRDARAVQSDPCLFGVDAEAPEVCGFGVAPEEAVGAVALVGDSHASGMRPAVDVLARARGWLGYQLTHTSCPLSTAVRDLRDPARFASCAAWKRRTFAWFARHPEVRTVVVAGLTGGTGVRPAGGRSRFETAVAGYVRAWQALPPTVERIVVLRDNPKSRPDAGWCVENALRAGWPPGLTCARPRGEALDRDAQVVAARRLRSARVQVVDLTSAYCDARLCYPVVGGALVTRDTNHLTPTFAATLAPQLVRAVERRSAATTARSR